MTDGSIWKRLKTEFTWKHDYTVKPLAFGLRSHTLFILTTIAIGLFTDISLYCIIVPIVPFILQDRVHVPPEDIQSNVSNLLAAYAAAAVAAAPIAGVIADKAGARKTPFLTGLCVLVVSTVLFFTGRSMWMLVVARILQGASCGIVWTAWIFVVVALAMCADTVGPKNLGKTIGSMSSIISFGELFGPFLGGALYKAAGVAAVLWLSIALLVTDLILRLLMIEKHVAARYIAHDVPAETDQAADNDATNETSPANNASHDNDNDTTPLLQKTDSNVSDPLTDEFYVIPKDLPWLVSKLPALYCFKSPSLITAAYVAFIQAVLLGAYDATVPTHAMATYDFDSLRAGLLFVPTGICNIILGPISGWAVDKYGTKIVALVGFTWLVPMLALLRVPQAHPYASQLAIFIVLLSCNGAGMGIVGSSGMVESGIIVDKFYRRNEDLFGERGPYATIYAMNTITFCAGLTVGPVVAGALVETINYGNMNACLAAISGISAIVCYIWLERPPRFLRRWRRKKRAEES